ncbi:MAG: IclR family transcriptional regulator [Polaromonas sp.]|jgi:IclR family pca regulon transcriptional regulator|nr:IclR family transcriptional regulator [Polaromonas sp.]
MNSQTMTDRTASPTAPAADIKPGPADNPKNVVNSVVKAFSVLRAFTPAQMEMTVSEIAAITGMDRGTTFRLIHTLVSLDYLRPVSVRKFRLTLKCLELGFLALSSQELWAHADPLLAGCVPDICDAASLGMLDGADVIYLRRVDQGLARHKVDRRPGRRVRAYGAALGHAILAFLPEPQQILILESAERVKLSERTLTDLDALLKRLRQVRKQGYAVSDGENAYGLRTIAVPVFDAGQQPIAGVSLTADAQRMSIEALIGLALPRALAIAAELNRAVRFSGGTIATSPSY